MATTVGELNVKLNIEMTRLEAQIQQANKKIAGMSKSWGGDISKAARSINSTLSTIGVGMSVSGLVAFGKSCLDLGGQIVDLSAQAGLGTDAFQTLRLAAMDNGSSGEEVATVFAKMNRSMQEAVEGSKAQAEAFAKLNLSAEYLKTLAPEKRFELIARAVVGAKDQQEAYNAAADIFGSKVGPKMNQLLQELAKVGFDKMAEGVKGIRLTPEQLKTLDDAGDKMQRLWELTKLAGAGGILAAAKVIDPKQVELMDQMIEGLELRKKAGATSIQWVDSDGITRVKDLTTKLNELKAAKDRLLGKAAEAKSPSAPPVLANDAEIVAIEEKARAAAKAEEATLQFAEAEKYAAKLEDVKAKAYDEATRKVIAQNKALVAEADAASAAINPSFGLAKQLGEIQHAADAGAVSLDVATAAIAKLKEEAVTKELDAFFGELDKKSADNMKQMAKHAKESKELADGLGDAFGDSFADAVMEGGKVGDMLKGLAKEILYLSLIKPMAASISSGVSGMATSLFSGMGFAGGGRPPVGKASIIGENGPELWVPDSAGTIISNSDMDSAAGPSGQAGGFNVVVNQTFQAGVSQSQLADGLRQTYEAAKSGVMDAIQRRRGGFGSISA